MRMFSWLNGLKRRFTRPTFATRRGRRQAPVAALVAYAERLEERALLSAVSWDGGAGTMNWNDADNWSGNVTPGATDDVTIDVPIVDATINFSGGTTQINSLNSSETLAISGGTLEIIDTSTIQALNLSGGTLRGSGDVSVSGQFHWTEGTLRGPGTTTANGGILLDGNPTLDGRTLDGRTLVNTGTAVWQSGVLNASNGAVIRNLAGAVFDIRIDNPDGGTFAGLRWKDGAISTFDNEGTLIRSTGRGLVFFQALVDNSGLVEVDSGNMGFNLGGSAGIVTTGDFVGAAGATLGLFDVNLAAGSSVTADNLSLQASNTAVSVVGGDYDVTGSTTLTGGDVQFTGNVSHVGSLITSAHLVTFQPQNTAVVELDALNLTGGTLTGPVDFVVNGQFNWIRFGTLSGAGTLTANGGLLLDSPDPRYLTLDGRTLINAGTAVWQSGNAVLLAGNGAVIHNLAGAVFDIRIDNPDGGTFAGLTWLGGAGPTFDNDGTLIRSTGRGRVGFQVVLNNSGLVEVDSGALELGIFTQTAGTLRLNGGAVLPGGSIDIQGGDVQGSGSVYGGISNSGIVSPGFSAGVLAFHGNYLQNAAGSYDLELGVSSDQVQVFGAVTLAGALNVSLISGFTPANNQIFTIIDNDGTDDDVSGSFDGLEEGGFVTAAGWQFEISYVGGDGNDVTLRSINQPPVANAGGPYLVVRGGTVQLNASASTDPNQSSASLSYAWDFDGDAQFDDAVGIAPIFSADGIDTLGNRTIAVQVTDAGGLRSIATATVQIVAVALIPDPLNPGQTALVVGGTAADDTIQFTPQGNSGNVVVTLNGANLGTFHPTGRLIAYGQGGNDTIQVAGGINLMAWMYGGLGNDSLYGGAGDDLLLDGSGDDTLIGGAGRDLMIGGTGADRLIGNAGDDILIAGITAYDNDTAALNALDEEWRRLDAGYASRVHDLQFGGGLNGDYVLDATTLFDDSSVDRLTGSAGSDLFIFDESRDIATDLTDELFINHLDEILGG